MKYLFMIISSLLLAGCSTMFPHPASLLEHPSLPAWEQSLKERIDRDLPKQAEIVAPRNQAVSRLYELVDLDQNGKDEAITFYRSEQDGRFTIHLLVHERQGEKWRLVTRQTVADGRAIDRLEVVSDAQHKQNHLVIGITSYGENTLYIIEQLLSKQRDVTKVDRYDRLSVNDLNQDRERDMVLLQKGSPSRLIYYKDILSEKRQETTLATKDGDLFAEHDLFEVDTINAARNKGLIVSYTRDAKMHIALFRLANDTLEQVRFGQVDEIVEPMYTFPKDVDQDGIVEFGHQYTPGGSEGREGEPKPRITAYYTWNGSDNPPFLESGFELREEQYIDQEYNFVMRFPANWATRETIEKRENRVRFINRDTKQVDFELEIIPKNQYIASDQKRKIKEGIDYVYVIDATKDYEMFVNRVTLVE